MCKTLHDTNEGKNLTPFSSGPVRVPCGSFFIQYIFPLYIKLKQFIGLKILKFNNIK